jgi:acyl-CoA hydrolase
MKLQGMNTNMAYELSDSVSMAFLFRADEDALVVFALPQMHHLGSVHFHSDTNRANVFYGGDGMSWFLGTAAYTMTDESEFQCFMDRLKSILINDTIM